MGWIGTQIREIDTGRLGTVTAENAGGRVTVLMVTWEDGSTSPVFRWYWATISDYEFFSNAGAPGWHNLGGW
jgi:hypothetical protein